MYITEILLKTGMKPNWFSNKWPNPQLTLSTGSGMLSLDGRGISSCLGSLGNGIFPMSAIGRGISTVSGRGISAWDGKGFSGEGDGRGISAADSVILLFPTGIMIGVRVWTGPTPSGKHTKTDYYIKGI